MNRKAAFAFTLVMALSALLAGCGGGSSGSPPPAPPTPLTITTSNASTINLVAGVDFSLTLQATGGNGPRTWTVISGALPDGLSLDASTGAVTGKATTVSVFSVDIQVRDSSYTTDKFFMFQVYNKLTIDPVDPPNAHLNAPYRLEIHVEGDAASGWSVMRGELPPGLQLAYENDYLASVSGTPTQAGTFQFTLKAHNYEPQNATVDITLVVDTAFAISKPILAGGAQDYPYSDSFEAVNGVAPYHWSMTGSLPSGLLLDASTGTVSGTPTVSGDFQYSVTATDSSSPPQSDTQPGSISLALPLQIVVTSQDAMLRTYYQLFLQATGGRPPYRWSIASGGLPPGISLSGPYLGGQPTQLGTYSFVIQVNDSTPQPIIATMPLTINVLPSTLEFSDIPLSPAPQGSEYHSQLPLRGGIPPYHWAIASGQLPDGVTLDTLTGGLDGTPTQLGTFEFNASATDSASPASAIASDFSIVIRTPLGRNDSIATATPIGNGQITASISPYSDPADSTTGNPDQDYFKLVANGGSIVHVQTGAYSVYAGDPLDTVIELLDVNGTRLLTCGASTYVSQCLNDDRNNTTLDSALDFKVPGAASTQTTFYLHVLDWRGDARPDMIYSLTVSGVVDPP